MGKNMGRKRINWKTVGGVLTALAAIVAIVAYFVPNPWAGRQPQFEFTFEGTGKPYYEASEGLYYADETNTNLLPFSITVEVIQYSGNQYSGKMNVWVEWIDKDQNNQVEMVGDWDSFRSQYQTPVKIDLHPYDLFRYSSLPGSIPAYSWNTSAPLSGTFDIVVRYNDGKELARETVTVVHTPWYHEALLNNGVVPPGDDVTANIRIVNLGDPSIFKITAVLYDTTTPDIVSITDEQDWWVERTWLSMFDKDIVTDDKVEKNMTYSATITVPGEYLLEGHTYAIGITAFKQLPYLKFADDSTWFNSGERWRYRDAPVYLSLFVVK
jgi:hypothetical protein